MTRIIIVGVGTIGMACARAALADGDMELAGLVDVDPAKIGRSLSDLSALDQAESEEEHEIEGGPPVVGRLTEAPEADVALLTTTSRLERAAPAVEEALDLGLHVVSSCEELVWPWYQHAELARRLDGRARAAGRMVLGAGVNPGFVMDALAVTLASVVRRVRSVRCIRRVDAALRRLPLQAKVGATMTVEEFHVMARAGKIGHVGLAESAALLAAGLGRQAAPGSIEMVLEPVVAESPTPSLMGLVKPGRVAGLHQIARWAEGDLSVELDLTMAVGLSDPKDKIEIGGPVPLHLRIAGGVPGDSATVAVLLNYARLAAHLGPGLRTMLDVPPAGCRGRDA